MVYAHQGGWDEFLLVVLPVLAFGVALWLAAKRAKDDEEPSIPPS